jgi:hypothetical protein
VVNVDHVFISRASRASSTSTFRDLVAASPDMPPPACCLNREIKCEHWRQFDREYLVAHLGGNLATAVGEITDLYATAGEPLSAEELNEELHFALSFSAIVPAGVPAFIVDRLVKETLDISHLHPPAYPPRGLGNEQRSRTRAVGRGCETTGRGTEARHHRMGRDDHQTI